MISSQELDEQAALYAKAFQEDWSDGVAYESFLEGANYVLNKLSNLKKIYEKMYISDKEDFLEFARKYSKDNTTLNKYFSYSNCREVPAISEEDKDN